MRCRKARSRPSGSRRRKVGPQPGAPVRFGVFRHKRAWDPRDPLNDAAHFLDPGAKRSPNDRKSGVEFFAMSSIDQAEKAVRDLPPEELAEFRRWFLEFDAAAWDVQYQTDVSAGRLDAVAEEAISDLRQGRTRPL